MQRHIYLIGFLLLAAVTGYGFWLNAQTQEQIERESIARAEALCGENNEVRGILTEMLHVMPIQRELEELSERERELRQARIRELEESTLARIDCEGVSEERRE